MTSRARVAGRAAQRPERNAVRDERGVILPLTLIFLVVLSTLVASLLAMGLAEPQITANMYRGMQAAGLAEAGAERALRTVSSPGVCSPCPGAWTALFGGAQSLPNLGTYTVRYRQIGDATHQIESTGQTTIGGGQRKVRVVATWDYMSKFAAMTNNDELRIDSSGHVAGSSGAIHSNARTRVDDASSVSQTATSATSECENCTDPSKVGNVAGSGANKPRQTFPTVDRNRMDYNLDTMGTLPRGWTGGGGDFECCTSQPPDGTYYASGRIRIGTVGSPSSSWKASFIVGSASAGEIEIEGSVNITGYTLAGAKIRIRDGATVTYNGGMSVPCTSCGFQILSWTVVQ